MYIFAYNIKYILFKYIYLENSVLINVKKLRHHIELTLKYLWNVKFHHDFDSP